MTQTPSEDSGERFQIDQAVRVGQAVKALRGRVSAQALSDRTADLGLRVPRSTIADMETGRRRHVAVHELLMLAAALGTTPSDLLTHGTMPSGWSQWLPERELRGEDVAAWWGGRMPSAVLPPVVGTPRDPEREQLSDLVRQRAECLGVELRVGSRAVLSEAADERAWSRDLLASTRERRKHIEDALRGLGANLGDEDQAEGQ